MTSLRCAYKAGVRFSILSSFVVLALAASSRATAATVGPLQLSAESTEAEIQKALDESPTNGEIVLAAGIYQISRPLMLRHDYQTLRGSGPGTILHLANEADCPVVLLGPPLTQTHHPATHLCLSDLVIDGNRANQKSELWRFAGDGAELNNDGVQIWNVTDSMVQHVTCYRCRSGGLVTASVRRLVVNDFNAYDNQFDGLACYQTEDSHFDGLNLRGNLCAGISLDLSFNHNFINNAILAQNDLGIFMRCSRDNSFQKLIISTCRHHGVFMAQTIAQPNSECVGNHFENLTVNNCGGRAFLVNDVTCRDNTILGANFIGNTLGGLGQPAANLVGFQDMAKR